MLDLATLDLSGIHEPQAQTLIRDLLQIIGEQGAAQLAARAEIQALRDELNRLKGEQGRPQIRPNAPAPTPSDHSSERERRTAKPWSKRSKCATLPVTRAETLRVDPATLPDDAVFKGYETVTVQDLVLSTEVVCFRKEKFYAASTRRTYLAPLPAGYTGQFGPGLRALLLTLYYAGQMSEAKLLAFVHSAGVQLSAGALSNLLIQQQEPFHSEKAALYRAGLASSAWQHIDDTSTRVQGHNQVCHIVCNPLYTAYCTLPSKDRLSVLDVLRDLAPRRFRLNGAALTYLGATQLPTRTLQVLATLVQEPPQECDEAGLAALLDQHLPGLGPQAQKWIRDATAVAAYHAQTGFPVVRLLLCDDAPQFKGVTEELALCWVHEGRHYKKLTPYLAAQRTLLDDFRRQFWAYYRELLAYRAQPSAADATRLEAAFDTVFATTTGYQALDARIAATRAHKAALLLVLQHPEIPLHNNPAELAARQRVRKRDVSLGPQSEPGRQCWDTFMSLVETAKKLGVSCYAYFADRVRQAGQIPPLDTLITTAAAALHLSTSWSTTSLAPNY